MARQNPNGEIPRHVKEAYERGVQDGRLQAAGGDGGGNIPFGGPCDACAALSRLMGMGLRHVRFTAHDDGKTVFAKAAIATPRWEKHYVLYTGTNWSGPGIYVPGLLRRVDMVCSGDLRPSPDRFDRD